MPKCIALIKVTRELLCELSIGYGIPTITNTEIDYTDFTPLAWSIKNQSLWDSLLNTKLLSEETNQYYVVAINKDHFQDIYYITIAGKTLPEVPEGHTLQILTIVNGKLKIPETYAAKKLVKIYKGSKKKISLVISSPPWEDLKEGDVILFKHFGNTTVVLNKIIQTSDTNYYWSCTLLRDSDNLKENPGWIKGEKTYLHRADYNLSEVDYISSASTDKQIKDSSKLVYFE